MRNGSVWPKDFIDNDTLMVSRRDVISDTEFYYFNIVFGVVLHGILSAVGVFSNIVNMVVFIQLGLKDSMSVGLLTLSATDFSLTLLQLAMCACVLTQVVSPESVVDPVSLRYDAFGWMKHVTYLISTWITTVISIERCLAVVLPFRVKQMFTRFRCGIILITIYVIHIACYIPVFTTQEFRWVDSGLKEHFLNTTIPHLVLTIVVLPGRKYQYIIDYVVTIALPILSQIILVICSVWMVYALKASSRIRGRLGPGNTSGVAVFEEEAKDGTSVSSNSIALALHRGVVATKKAVITLTGKERRLVTTILTLAVLLTICNVPKFLSTTVFYVVPGMNSGRYPNAQKMMLEMTHFFNTFCCSINFVVYLKLNTNYRQLVKRMSRFDLKANDKAGIT